MLPIHTDTEKRGRSTCSITSFAYKCLKCTFTSLVDEMEKRADMYDMYVLFCGLGKFCILLIFLQISIVSPIAYLSQLFFSRPFEVNSL